MIPSEEAMQATVGTRFPGGSYRIEHWENFLLSDATGVAPLPNDLAHPAHLFHVAINGVGTSITELFALAEAPSGTPVSIDYYDWTIERPLREDETYILSGGVQEFVRGVKEGAPVRDSFVYEIQLDDEKGAAIATVAWRWHFWRIPPAGPEGSA